jgi:hypothetical protein
VREHEIGEDDVERLVGEREAGRHPGDEVCCPTPGGLQHGQRRIDTDDETFGPHGAHRRCRRDARARPRVENGDTGTRREEGDEVARDGPNSGGVSRS